MCRKVEKPRGLDETRFRKIVCFSRAPGLGNGAGGKSSTGSCNGVADRRRKAPPNRDAIVRNCKEKGRMAEGPADDARTT